MSVQFFPLAGAKTSALAMQAALADSVCRLFQSDFTPNPASTLADMNAHEADYAGYASKTFTAWNDPILAPGSGYMIQSPLVQFQTTTPDDTSGNVIGGCYLVDDAGNLRMVVIFTEPVPMQLPGQGIPLSLIWLFPSGT